MEGSNSSHYHPEDISYDSWDMFHQPPIDEDTFNLIEVIVRIIITGSISLFGVIANIINGIVFYRQGILSDSSTVGLTGLAVADFFCCLLSLWGNVCLLIYHFFETPEYTWRVKDIYVFSGLRPKSVFIQITCWLTAYIAMERCVSVVLPFKVKNIFTAKRSLCVICTVFILTVLLYYPQYLGYFPQWVKNPMTNKSILEYDRSGIITDEMELAFLYLCPVLLRIISVATVIVCNLTILWKLKLSTKFRKSSAATSVVSSTVTAISNYATSTDNNTKDTNATTKPEVVKKNVKEKRLLRMISLICAVFLICFIPDVFLVIMFYVIKWLVHWYYVEIAHAFSSLLESINSSCNIFIYYTMSSRYKQEIWLLIKKEK